MGWPPTTHQDVQDAVATANAYVRKRDVPRTQFAGPYVTGVPSAMSSPPTVTYLAASAITSNVVRRFTPPAMGSAQGGVGLCLGSSFEYFDNRNQGTGWTVLTSAASAGATTLGLANNVGTGTYSVQPLNGAQTYTRAQAESLETVTITGITGASSPFTATLSAPLANAHSSADQVVTTAVPAPGFNSGSALIPNKSLGSVPLVGYEVITDAPTLEFYTYFPTGAQYRLIVDGQAVAVSPATLGVGGAGQPTNNQSGFISVAFSTRQLRRVRMQTTGALPVIGVSTAPIDTVICPPEPALRAMIVSDSYTVGFDGIQDQLARLMGWDNMLLDQVGGTGYEADNTANVGGPARVGYRLGMIESLRPDVLIIALGLNDDPASGTLAATIAADLDLLIAALPNAKIFTVGPWSVSNSVNTTKAPIATAIRTAALARGLPYIDTILGLGPAMNPWVTGTGNSGALAANGNADIVIGPDGTHPTSAGLAYNALRLSQGVFAALGA